MLLTGVGLLARYAATRACQTLSRTSRFLKLLRPPQYLCDFPCDLTLLVLHLIGLGWCSRVRAVETLAAGPAGEAIAELIWELPAGLAKRVFIAFWDIKEQVSRPIR